MRQCQGIGAHGQTASLATALAQSRESRLLVNRDSLRLDAHPVSELQNAFFFRCRRRARRKDQPFRLVAQSVPPTVLWGRELHYQLVGESEQWNTLNDLSLR